MAVPFSVSYSEMNFVWGKYIKDPSSGLLVVQPPGSQKTVRC